MYIKRNRDSESILELIKEFQKLSGGDLRFWQTIYNLNYIYAKDNQVDQDLWYLEDKDFEKWLEDKINKMRMKVK